MSVEIGDLAAALRITDGTMPEEPIKGILRRLKTVAEAHANIEAPEAPDKVRDEACIRMAAYLYDQPSTGSGLGYANAWRNSGAAALVSRWVRRRLGDPEEVPRE